jgi:membrane-bound ClpP family serine protease
MSIRVMPIAVKEKEIKTNEPALQRRLLWQRFIYPVVGLILIILGVILWLLPVVPGFPLIIIGLPLLFCFHPPFELRIRKYLRGIGRFLMKKMRKKRNRS